MNKNENKTKATNVSVEDFINSVPDEQKREDAKVLIEIMNRITGKEPVMWGPSIIGFDQYHYKYESGREGDMAATGFSPRKPAISIYLLGNIGRAPELLSELGPHKMAKGCLYIKRLSDVDINVLEDLIKDSYDYVMKHVDTAHRAE